jgi:hypothetical protein
VIVERVACSLGKRDAVAAAGWENTLKEIKVAAFALRPWGRFHSRQARRQPANALTMSVIVGQHLAWSNHF